MAIIFQNDFSNQGDFNKWKNSFSSKWKWLEKPPHSRFRDVANLQVGFVQYGLTSEPITLDGNTINGTSVTVSFDGDFDLHENAYFKVRISNDGGKLWYDYEILLENQKKSMSDFHFDLIPELVPEVGQTMDILVQFELESQINDAFSKINISSIILESDRPGGGDGTTPTRTPQPPPNP